MDCGACPRIRAHQGPVHCRFVGIDGMTAPPPRVPIQADPARCLDGLSELRSVETVEAEHDANNRVATFGALRIELVAEDLLGCVGDPEHGCVLGELDERRASSRVPAIGSSFFRSDALVRTPGCGTCVSSKCPHSGAQRRAASSRPYPLPCRLRISRGAPLDRISAGSAVPLSCTFLALLSHPSHQTAGVDSISLAISLRTGGRPA
jgi:hypothetical protein